jgi:hypothetical protein
MAKLTLSFKGHLISIHHLGEQPAFIGRDMSCEVPIDSLAVAHHHAVITAYPDGYSIAALDPDHPVILNNEQVEQAALHHGDLIQIGKHTLHFSEAAQEVAAIPAAPQPAAASGDWCPAPELAYVQIQSGPELGRVVALHRDSTRLTEAGAGTDHIVITRRGAGYVVACGAPGLALDVNGEPAETGAEVPLPDAAVIEAGTLRCQFFCGGAG